MVLDSGQELALLDGEDSEAVVPVAAGHEQFVVGGESKELGGDGEVLGEGTSHTLPPGPAVVTQPTHLGLVLHVLQAVHEMECAS